MNTRRWVLKLLAAAILLAYPLAGLYPYRWESPELQANMLQALPDGNLRFAAPGPGIARTPQPPQWAGEARRAHRFDVALSVYSHAADQSGPARILTLSRNPSLRNFTIAQDGRDLVVRIRTTKHDLNGIPQYRVRDVFGAERWTDIRIGVDADSLYAEVDGVPRLRDKLPQAPLRNWDLSYRLALGNELTGNRPWLGEIRRAVVATAEGAVDYIQPGALEIPAQLISADEPPVLAPFQDVEPWDAAINVLGFLPLGLVFGLWVRRQGWATYAGGMVLIFAISLAIETLQLGIPGRYPSINDLILNTLGGVMGILLTRWPEWSPFVLRAGRPSE